MSLEGMSEAEIQSLAALAQSISSNPKTRIGFQALIKAAHPETATPELDAAHAIHELKKQNEAMAMQLAADKAERAAKETELKKWGEVVGQGLCVWNDVPAVQAFMTENGIADPVNGARLWKAQSAIATPQAMHPTTFAMPQDHLEMWKKGGRANLDKTAKEAGHQALLDFRAGKIV